jgi:hypothetical protein
MNPLTGGPYYLELALNRQKSSPSVPKPKLNVPNVVFNDKSYINDPKFHEEDKQRRDNQLQKKQEAYMKRREASVLREAGRWQAIENEYAKFVHGLERKRSKWKAGQKNNPSQAFNLISLDYDPTLQGEYLRAKDQEKKYREGLRLFNLDARMNSGYNIITGATRQSPLPMRNYINT